MQCVYTWTHVKQFTFTHLYTVCCMTCVTWSGGGGQVGREDASRCGQLQLRAAEQTKAEEVTFLSLSFGLVIHYEGEGKGTECTDRSSSSIYGQLAMYNVILLMSMVMIICVRCTSIIEDFSSYKTEKIPSLIRFKVLCVLYVNLSDVSMEQYLWCLHSSLV